MKPIPFHAYIVKAMKNSIALITLTQQYQTSKWIDIVSIQSSELIIFNA